MKIDDDKRQLRNIIRSAVKDFIHAHPEAMQPKWTESITKRITGQVYCHYVHNREKDEREAKKRRANGNKGSTKKN